MSFSEKIFRLLLRAYPRGYRTRYSESMEQVFRDSQREARAFGDLIKLWGRALTDWTVSVPARHWERITRHGGFNSRGNPALRCLFFARFEASSFSHREITIEDLLLGILREDPSVFALRPTNLRAGAFHLRRI